MARDSSYQIVFAKLWSGQADAENTGSFRVAGFHAWLSDEYFESESHRFLPCSPTAVRKRRSRSCWSSGIPAWLHS